MVKMDALNAGCVYDRAGCDWLLNDLGPPPDSILRIPPPPLPQFLEEDLLKEIRLSVAQMENDTTCHWCHWARRLDVNVVDTTTPGAELAMEDTWFFVILASCLMLTLGALLTALVYLRLHGKSLKGAWDFGSFSSENGSIVVGSGTNSAGSGSLGGNGSTLGTGGLTATSGPVGSKACQQVRYSVSGEQLSNSGGQVVNGNVVNGFGGTGGSTAPLSLQRSVTRALWAGVKTTTEGNHYTITHVQPFEQKRPLPPTIPLPVAPICPCQQPDEDSAGYTTLSLNPSSTTDNKIYYCCTDLMVGLPVSEPRQVTSLDDPPTINPQYVNMAALNNSNASCPKRRLEVGPPLVYSGSVLPALNSRPIRHLPSTTTSHVHPPIFAQRS